MLRLRLHRLLGAAWWAYAAFVLLAIGARLLLQRTRLFSYPPLSADYPQYLWLLFPILFAALVYRTRGKGYWGVRLCGALYVVPAVISWEMFYSNVCELLSGLACAGVLIYAVARGDHTAPKALSIATVLCALFAAVGLLFVFGPYRMNLLLAVIDPQASPLAEGWLSLGLRSYVEASRPFGKGDIGLLQEAYHIMELMNVRYVDNHMFFSRFLFYLGYVPTALLTAAMAGFLYLGFRRANRLSGAFYRLLATGTLLLLGFQALFAVLFGLGVPLIESTFFPFISTGNTASAVNLAQAGLLTSLFRTDGLFTDSRPRRR